MARRRDREPTPLPEHIRVPHPARFRPDRADYEVVLTLHEEAVRRDVDGYLDPSTGAWVFTARFLEERGYCCEHGCRHCPWVERP